MYNINNSNYFLSHESNMFQFYATPKELFINPQYKKMSADAKLLYSFMLDRNSLSLKNNWIDQNNRIYIIFARTEAQEILCIANQKATKIYKELQDNDLIKEVKQGLGKPNIIYVKKFVRTVENIRLDQNHEKHESHLMKNMTKQSCFSWGINTNNNNTEINNTNKKNLKKSSTIQPSLKIASEKGQEKTVAYTQTTAPLPTHDIQFYRTRAMALSEHIYHTLGISIKQDIIEKKWTNDIKLIVEEDKRSIEEIDQIIKFIYTRDTYWRTIIKNPSKLRQHWATIWAQMLRPQGGGSTPQQHHNFEQRFYSDAQFDSFLANKKFIGSRQNE